MNIEPSSYNLRRAAIRALNHGDFKSAAELIIMAKEVEVKEMKKIIEEMKKNYNVFFHSTNIPFAIKEEPLTAAAIYEE